MRILDGQVDIHPITMRLHYLDDHFPPHLLPAALKWLMANNIVGQSFVRWFKFICSNSDLEMHRILLAVVQNAAAAPLFANKNFRV